VLRAGGSWDFDGFDFGDWRLLEIYLFVVAPHGGRVAATFPATFALAGSDEVHGGVFYAFSDDGRTFSTPVRLLRSAVFPYLFSAVARARGRGAGGNLTRAARAVLSARTADHAAGWERAGDTTRVTIEVNVTGIGTSSELLPQDLAAHNLTDAVPAHCTYTVETAALKDAAAATVRFARARGNCSAEVAANLQP
jgi:hypothetical protein